jgi:hypothetical protein
MRTPNIMKLLNSNVPFTYDILDYGGCTVKRSGDVSCDHYVKVETYNNQFPFGIYNISLSCYSVVICESSNLIIIKRDGYYLIGSVETNRKLPLLRFFTGLCEISLKLKLGKNSNITRVIGTQCTYIHLQNRDRKVIAGNNWFLDKNKTILWGDYCHRINTESYYSNISGVKIDVPFEDFIKRLMYPGNL